MPYMPYGQNTMTMASKKKYPTGPTGAHLLFLLICLWLFTIFLFVCVDLAVLMILLKLKHAVQYPSSFYEIFIFHSNTYKMATILVLRTIGKLVTQRYRPLCDRTAERAGREPVVKGVSMPMRTLRDGLYPSCICPSVPAVRRKVTQPLPAPNLPRGAIRSSLQFSS